jgi:hypothetical protein
VCYEITSSPALSLRSESDQPLLSAFEPDSLTNRQLTIKAPKEPLRRTSRMPQASLGTAETSRDAAELRRTRERSLDHDGDPRQVALSHRPTARPQRTCWRTLSSRPSTSEARSRTSASSRNPEGNHDERQPLTSSVEPRTERCRATPTSKKITAAASRALKLRAEPTRERRDRCWPPKRPPSILSRASKLR